MGAYADLVAREMGARAHRILAHATVNNDHRLIDEENQELVLRFDIDALREAGASLGRIQSTVVRPKTTFEALIARAQALRDRVAARDPKVRI
jgi:hypothetical protein